MNNKLSLKTLVRQFYRFLIHRTRVEYDRSNLRRSAIIFSPHQDDETLGCGGTIIRKKQAGADIKIVFMTDGCQSHAHLIPENQVKSIRANEALAAAQKLGLQEHDVSFLEFKDGTLDQTRNLAIQNVAKIILKYLPEEIFIPYYNDGVSDHNATNEIVVAALKTIKFDVTVYEYPIWFWNHWPWTRVEGSKPNLVSFVKKTIMSGFRLLKDFRLSVYIGDVFDIKRTALDQHQSQMKQLILHPRWLTLRDVSEGDFLDCFFQNYELFRRYSLTHNSEWYR
ncbi:LmbE-like protein [Moorena producens PAL-8-15-08-1]|uniref:LmbE-like protein n=1 Tax=Moorena producens PAL-8-15-08-1 TaxID=1458985 RepID=A0A1D8TMR8_9CYAN|nr:PIG-L family deacetylase [Moorena producens]AOW98941.1 LmbE-like protein [Moorena producens PAL-8-15-08-1]